MQNAKIIDADGHDLDGDTDIRDFMEEPYYRRQGSLLAKDKWDASMYGKLGMNITDVPTRLRDMDTEGIEVSVLFPTTGFAGKAGGRKENGHLDSFRVHIPESRWHIGNVHAQFAVHTGIPFVLG